jgi:hypothetical protein
MLKPFRQAVAFQLGRVPMQREIFDRLSNEAKLRAFTIAGLARKAVLEEAHGLATKAITEGQTLREFQDALGELLDRNGGTVLSPQRLELISQNNLAVAYSAGRYAQMNDPDITRDRPYRQYPLGPNDMRTSQICLSLEGLVARYDDPIWDHITPPNHHGERHLQVLTLTEEQARELGIYESPGELEYPHINGQTILPDPGFDFSPGLLTSDDRALVEAAEAMGEILPAKAAADYQLEKLESVGRRDLPEMPELMPRVVDASDAVKINAAWSRFRDLFGIAEDVTGTIVNDVFGDGVIVNRSVFDYMAIGGKEDRAAYFPLLKDAVENPFEVWMIARQRGEQTVFHKRYIALYNDRGKKKAAFAIVDSSPEGWVMKNSFRDSDWTHLERQREGRLLMSKARRKK